MSILSRSLITRPAPRNLAPQLALAREMEKLGGRREEDLALWQAWKLSASDQDLNKLFDAFEGLINVNINKWRQQIPRVAVRVEAERLTLEAFRRYDPKMGASLASYVDQWLQKLWSFVNSRGNLLKIPEDRISMITRYQEAENHLRQMLKREPSAAEVSDAMGIPVKEVARFRKEAFKTLTEGSSRTDFSSIRVTDPTVQHAIATVYFDLQPEEKLVYEHLYGVYGRVQTTSTNDIARLVGFTPSKVSRLKKKIAQKLSEYLD